jgi:magnesium transporter
MQDVIQLERPDYEQEIIEIIQSKDSPKNIREKLEDYHENDLAAVLERLSREDRKKLYQILGVERVSELFAYLDDVEKYINELDAEKAADIIESMDADDAVDVLEELEDEKREELVGLIDEEARNDITLIQSYDDDEVGSKMTTNFIMIKRGLTVKQAMKELVSQAADNDNISTIYVCEDDDTFYGAIDLKDLIIARNYVELEDLIVTSYPYVYANELVSQCIEELKDYSEDSIPVLGSERQILGVITAQDIVEVVDDEMGEDYAKLAGLIEEEEKEETLIDSVKKRIPWLGILLVLGLCVSTITGMFESVIAELPLVVFFQSLILGMSGNVGTQSLAVTIRVLTDEDELTLKQIGYRIFKEIRIGFLNGFLLGMASFVFIGLYIWLIKGKAVLDAFAVSSCIGTALLMSMTVSSFTGTIIPILFKKANVDPAVASGPLISTVNDMVAVVTYYGLAWGFLINTLHLAG